MSANLTADCGRSFDGDALDDLDIDAIVSLIQCRYEELRTAGCESPGCLVLAGRLDVDLEQAARLVVRGCPPELALRILL